MPGDFTRNADFSLPVERLKRAIKRGGGRGRRTSSMRRAIATALFGNSLGANMFMLGLPSSTAGCRSRRSAIEKAIELNGEAVKMNLAAFRWGRRAAENRIVRGLMRAAEGADDGRGFRETLDEVIARRVDFLTAYQNARYGARYARGRARARGGGQGRAGLDRAHRGGGAQPLQAHGLQGRVRGGAALHRRPFRAPARRAFEGENAFEFHLAPPMLARKDR